MIDRKRSARALLFKNGDENRAIDDDHPERPTPVREYLAACADRAAAGGNTPGYVARAVDIGGLARHRALGDGDTGNPRFHLDACFYNVLKRLAAPRGHAQAARSRAAR
jgi:hypothetical protein